MEFLIGVLGVLLLGGLYVGLGLADRGREACRDCSLPDDPESCGSCPLVVAPDDPESCRSCPLVVAPDGLENPREGDTSRSASASPEPRRQDGASRRRWLPMWRPSGD